MAVEHQVPSTTLTCPQAAPGDIQAQDATTTAGRQDCQDSSGFCSARAEQETVQENRSYFPDAAASQSELGQLQQPWPRHWTHRYPELLSCQKGCALPKGSLQWASRQPLAWEQRPGRGDQHLGTRCCTFTSMSGPSSVKWLWGEKRACGPGQCSLNVSHGLCKGDGFLPGKTFRLMQRLTCPAVLGEVTMEAT